MVKTVVEGGTTVEVTSQDASDSEEDDENVYNVKVNLTSLILFLSMAWQCYLAKRLSQNHLAASWSTLKNYN